MSSTPIALNPTSIAANPAFHQGMLAPAGPLVFVGGQNGIDASGTMAEGLAAQTERALHNVLAVLAEAGTDQEHVVKLSVHLKDGVDPRDAFAATRSVWGDHPTAITVVIVVGLAHPEALVEIDAIATAR